MHVILFCSRDHSCVYMCVNVCICLDMHVCECGCVCEGDICM